MMRLSIYRCHLCCAGAGGGGRVAPISMDWSSWRLASGIRVGRPSFVTYTCTNFPDARSWRDDWANIPTLYVALLFPIVCAQRKGVGIRLSCLVWQSHTRVLDTQAWRRHPSASCIGGIGRREVCAQAGVWHVAQRFVRTSTPNRTSITSG